MLKLVSKLKSADTRAGKTKETPQKQKRESKPRRTPFKDEYREPEFNDIRITIDEYKDINFSVKRMGDLGLPYLDMRFFLKTDRYTGFDGKRGLCFPVEKMRDVIDTLEWVYKQCWKKDLIYQDDDEA